MVDGSIEEWKPVVGFEDVYHVSNHGNVRRICKYCGPVHHWQLSKRGHGAGYVIYVLCRCKKRKTKLGHVLVAEAFFGPRSDGMCVNHKDGNKRNNRISNLEYVTNSQNHIHAVMTGLRPAMKLTPEKVREIRKLEGKLPSPAVARRFGITKQHVLYIWRGKAWSHLE
jgi:hypothetical protein